MMTSWRCKEADIWMAAHEAGALGDAERIRLQEHLEGCAACRRRAGGMGALVRLLRDKTPHLSEARMEHLWRALERGPVSAPGERRAPTGVWRRVCSAPRWASAGVVAFASTLLLALWLWPAARVAVQPSVAPPWAGEGPERLYAPADRPLVLRSRRETVTARHGSALRRMPGMLELRRGELLIRTEPGQRSLLAVRLGPLVVRPRGTAYRLRWPAAELHVAVAHGRVEVRSDDGRVVEVAAGHGLHWGRTSRQLTVAEHQGLVAALGLTPARRPPVSLAPPRVAAAAVAAPVVSRLRGARSGTPHPRPRNAKKALPRATPPSRRALATTGVGPQELVAIERLLLAGKTRSARQEARLLLTRRAAVAALQTLIAESFVREQRYAAARDAYLAGQVAEPDSSLGADALYTAGVLEFEQLKRGDLAERRFARYLERYGRGRQREGAYYMLFRALRARKASAAASGVVSRYRREFPDGRYTSVMQ